MTSSPEAAATETITALSSLQPYTSFVLTRSQRYRPKLNLLLYSMATDQCESIMRSALTCFFTRNNTVRVCLQSIGRGDGDVGTDVGMCVINQKVGELESS